MSRKASARQEPAAPTVPHPRQTGELVGQAAAERTLRQAWDSGRLPHAWLLTGARGIGKATLAYRFAKFVLAGGAGETAGLFGDPPRTLDVDPEHPAARQVASAGHPDLFVLEPGRPNPGNNHRPSKDITVHQVREAVHFCFMTPAAGGWRIVLVDPADEMNSSAANGLLKLLEEPPKQALLLLVAHNPARLLPTIRSRCAQLACPLLDDATVQARLRARYPDLAEADAAALARLAEGSIGRALELAEAGGLELYREMTELLAAMPSPSAAALHGFADKLAQGGEAGTFRLGGDLLAWWLARLARAGATGALPPPVVAGEDQVMRRLLDRAPLEPWLDLWDKTLRLVRQAEQRNFDRKQVVLTLFLEIEATVA
jgi:DNA polymerase-3 subunit delta'